MPYTVDPGRNNETGLLVSKYCRLDKIQVRVIHNKNLQKEIFSKCIRRRIKRICSLESKNVFHTRNISEIDPQKKDIIYKETMSSYLASDLLKMSSVKLKNSISDLLYYLLQTKEKKAFGENWTALSH